MKLFDGNEYPESLIREKCPCLHKYCLDHKCFEETIFFEKTNPFPFSPLFLIFSAAIIGIVLSKLWLNGIIWNLFFAGYFTFFLVFVTLSFQYYANKLFCVKGQPVRTIRILDGNLYIYECGSLIYSGSMIRIKIRKTFSPIGDSLYPYILFRKCFQLQVHGIKSPLAFGMNQLIYNVFDDYLRLRALVKD
ncbi:MAG: hypothetical protein Q4C95_08285 [Planctomycetia bacterium]|nr:hypothetical protein [Planctomycetia bacterium]